jgi:hypothetical protein
MPRPKGESHHSAKLSETRVEGIKEAIVKSQNVGKVASSFGIGYQMAYRIARGETWAHIEPTGDLLNGVSRGRPRTISLKNQYNFWRLRRQRGVPTKKLAIKAKLSPSSVRRLVAEFELMLAHRVSRLELTSGGYGPARRKYGLTDKEAERLDRLSLATTLTERQQHLVDEEFPKLERKIGGKT